MTSLMLVYPVGQLTESWVQEPAATVRKLVTSTSIGGSGEPVSTGVPGGGVATAALG